MADELVDCEQQKLADIVKGLHGKLRKQLREANGDHKKVWQSHCTDKKSLEEYASAMRVLAVDHWTKQSPEGRVEWCYRTAMDYFRGGGLKKCTEKQRRRQQFSENVNKCCCCLITEEPGICPKVVFPPVDDKLLLLDVGSCFNPFAMYEDIYPVSIDLQPADSMVYKCDFLNLEIQELQSLKQELCPCESSGNRRTHNLPQKTPSEEQPTVDQIHAASLQNEKFSQEAKDNLLTSPSQSCQPNSIAHRTDMLCLEDFLKEGEEIKIFPSQTFHIIVFSLLLSYFPSAAQRWECCCKAHRLLRTNGILLIVTPDSNHQNKNAAMIKSWKTGIESLGFVRWKYKKQTHLHCMAFRKVALCHSCNHGKGGAEMMYIPPDFQEEEEDCGAPILPHSEEDNVAIMDFFSELPDL